MEEVIFWNFFQLKAGVSPLKGLPGASQETLQPLKVPGRWSLQLRDPNPKVEASGAGS